MKTQVWSVSALVGYLKNSLENDIVIQSILVKGEISNFTHHRSGHLYFSLKDGNASMPCVMFASSARKLNIIPKEGMKVIISAKVSLYEARGSIQLYVNRMQSDGIGDLYLKLEQLKKKLFSEGLFDTKYKKAIPSYPMRIGIISAKTGAAIQDVLSIIARRWPMCDVKVYPSLVQGENAAKNIITCLLEADQNQHDVILLVRGGGSIEDLWCFNDEMLARTIFQMNTCVITGVGHETDTTLVDYVSDHRAPTPSAAAELVTPDYKDLLYTLQSYKHRCIQSMQTRLQTQRKDLEFIKRKPLFSDKEILLEEYSMRLAMAIQHLEKYENKLLIQKKNLYMMLEKLQSKAQQIYTTNQIKCNTANEILYKTMHFYQNNRKEHFMKQVALLDAYSPLKILQRGYSVTLKKDQLIKSIDDVQVGEEITTRLLDGTLVSKVVERKN